MKYVNQQILDQIYNDRFIAVDLIEIHLKNQSGVSDPLYYTNNNFDILFDSPTAPTAGTNKYTAQGQFIGFSAVNEELDIKVGKFSVTLSAVERTANPFNIAGVPTPTSMLEKFLSYECEGKRVVIYKAFLEYNTLQIIPNPIVLFDGIIYNLSVSESASSCSVSLDCATLFSDFERTNGRRTNNKSNWLYQGNEYDKSMEKSGWLKTTQIEWGKPK